jgi:putative ABC transport system substrate-binding protein
MFNGRRQPSCDGTSRMTRECQVRICERLGVLYIFASAFAQGHWKRLAQLALDYRLPTMYGFREFVDRGGLLSYGASISDGYRRAATLIDKIFKGSRPSDLPVEQPTRFELIINARTAKALGVTIPDVVLVQAHEVPESAVRSASYFA